MSNDSKFFLNALDDEKLIKIVELDIEDKEKYFNSLVSRFYPQASEEETLDLIENYNSSFIMEYLYRNTEALSESFTVVYTPTGMIRELVNDLYFIEQEYKFKIN